MASNNYQFVAFVIVAIVLPAVAMATEYVVGDDKGWIVGVNYTQWAEGKVFHVGDKLVFQYVAPHNVMKVDGNGFKGCIPSNNLTKSGNDTIALATAGRKWYICGVPGHCQNGQKLVINVESDGPAPQSNLSIKIFSSSYQIFFAALALLAIMAI